MTYSFSARGSCTEQRREWEASIVHWQPPTLSGPWFAATKAEIPMARWLNLHLWNKSVKLIINTEHHQVLRFLKVVIK